MLDTNSLFGLLRHPQRAWRSLLEHSRLGSVRLVVPELVWRELEVKQQEAVQEALDQRRDAHRLLGVFGVLSVEEAASALVGRPPEAVDALRRSAVQAGAVTAPLPRVAHDDVVQRALDRRRPFDRAGHNGYRDTLLWQTVLDIANSGARVLLVSNDGRAFACPDDSSRLHPDLVDDAARLEHDDGAIDLCTSLGAAAQQASGDGDALRAAVTRLLFEQEGCLESVQASIGEALIDRSLSGAEMFDLGWQFSVVEAKVVATAGMQELDVVTVHHAPQEGTWAQVEVSVEAHFALRADASASSRLASANAVIVFGDPAAGWIDARVTEQLICCVEVRLDDQQQLIGPHLVSIRPAVGRWAHAGQLSLMPPTLH